MLDVDGQRVHLLRADPGPDPRPTAPTQLLVHGAAASGTVWLDVIARLASVGPVVAPDLPGSIFGETTTNRPRQARLAASVAFLDQLTVTLGLDRVTLHGLSMGGTAGLRFAAEHPATSSTCAARDGLGSTPRRHRGVSASAVDRPSAVSAT